MSACSDTHQGGGPGYITGEGVVEQIPVADRVPLPTLQGATLDGGSFDSRDHAGTLLVVNVWGSWCPPCRKEAPGLRRGWEETRNQGVQFVGIDVRDNDAAAIAYERRFKITYPSITTADSGPALLALGSILPANAIPSTVVVDRDGKVAARVIGGTTYLTLRDLVDDVLAEANRG
ncbi:TlpA disulfide reductase family protein [Nocardioides sp. InS609-2]|uniref:TlpA family protein disulfide reductase n=1 Tax=Nocardioides sp. InS609-2 TaxID=2760705 RepID=UPI0020BD6C35|nr:TlpA disulfide reductase family protein [Nocardioides sp. InS609-2]